jgi:hypothetical protein
MYLEAKKRAERAEKRADKAEEQAEKRVEKAEELAEKRVKELKEQFKERESLWNHENKSLAASVSKLFFFMLKKRQSL